MAASELCPLPTQEAVVTAYSTRGMRLRPLRGSLWVVLAYHDGDHLIRGKVAQAAGSTRRPPK